MSYYAVIERYDGSTYVQPYKDFYALVDLVNSLGDGYFLVDIF